jgi:hypothetical protein
MKHGMMLIGLLALLTMVQMVILVQAQEETPPIDRTFEVQLWPADLAWDGSSLWYADGRTDRIYQLDPETGKEISSFASPSPWPRGLTWDGQYLWLAGGNVFTSEDFIFKMDTQGNEIARFNAPEQRVDLWPSGLAWDNDSPGGPYLWVSIYYTKVTPSQIYKLDPKNELSAVGLFRSPTSWGVQGLAWDGEYLWMNTFDTTHADQIIKVDPDTGEDVASYWAPGPSTNRPKGLAWEESLEEAYLWYSDEVSYDDPGVIYRFVLENAESTPTPTATATATSTSTPTSTPTTTTTPTPTATPTATSTGTPTPSPTPTVTATTTPTLSPTAMPPTVTPTPTDPPPQTTIYLPLILNNHQLWP